MGRSRRELCGLAVAALLVVGGCGGESDAGSDGSAASSGGEVFELRYGDANPPADTSPMTNFANHFIERLEANSGGRVKVRYFPNSELGGTAQMLSGAQSGSIDFVNLTTGVLATVEPKWLLFSLPFLITEQPHLYALADSEVGTELLQSLEGKGLTGLALNDNGPFIFETKDRVIESPDDMRGLKLRIIQDPASQAMLKEVGAQPVPLDFPEVYGSLQQGVIDGTVSSPSATLAAKLIEVAPNISDVIPQWVVQSLFISNRTMERLPADLQEAVRASADEAQQFASEQTADVLTTGFEALREADAELSTGVDIAPFEQRMEPVYEQLEDQIGADVIERARAVVSASR